MPGLLWLILPAAILLLHARSHLPSLSDDALISLRYADRLLHGHGLTWNDGERVEGYSNLLWTLACAAVGGPLEAIAHPRPGLALIEAARAMGVLGMIAALAALFFAYPPQREPGGPAPALAGALAIAVSGPIAVWAIGGLEEPFVAAFLAWGIALGLRTLDRADAPRGRSALAAGTPLALLTLTRPDGALLAAGVCAWIAWARRGHLDALGLAARTASLPALAWLGQLGFRLAYYHDWVPNTARAKLSLSIPHLRSGALYLADGVVSIAPWLLAIGLGWWLGRPERGDRARAAAAAPAPARLPGWPLMIAPLILWTAYLAAIGGDFFPARRLWVPSLVVLAFLLAETVSRLAARGRTARAAFGAAAAIAATAVLQVIDPAVARARLERWEWDGEVVGHFLRDAFGDRRPLLAVEPAGAVPYFSGLRSLDLLGLNDRWLALHPPPDFGRGPMGHELGNGDYALRREPDLVIFCTSAGSDTACFRSGREMQADPRFAARYARVFFEADEPRRVRALVWTRRDGGPLGIERRPGVVVVPAWHLNAGAANVVRMAPDGRPSLIVTPFAPAGIAGLALEPGRWRMVADSDDLAPVLRVRDSATRAMLGQRTAALEFESHGAVDLGVATQREGAYVRGVVLARIAQ